MTLPAIEINVPPPKDAYAAFETWLQTRPFGLTADQLEHSELLWLMAAFSTGYARGRNRLDEGKP